MSNKLISELQSTLPKGMVIPREIELLYEWIEANNLYTDSEGVRIGFLCLENSPTPY
ncbi:hypothetical protein [Chondrinema litorale]|uniref:hypothetical protein n=1 Tax=Chondrinema litorale TaxID=2994555 RepID=UPI0025436B66|nr:hypothetical protein [Chondrinema litorale]UZR99996.1 hypothetical protein OQ292_39130 [Chondrinema litorale]